MNALRSALFVLGLISLSGCLHHPGGDHAAHQAMLSQPPGYERSMTSYQVPDVTLVDQAGKPVNLPQLLKSSEPYALNFIFTSCTTICPIMSASFFQLQQELGPDMEGLQLISISIDPEYDTPATLRKYAKKYAAGAHWRFLTGQVNAINITQKTFAGYVSDKMDHRPFTLLKVPGVDQWVRVDGLASGSDIAGEYRRLVAH